jgi:isopenicillin N synthase-like dioxygenase
MYEHLAQAPDIENLEHQGYVTLALGEPACALIDEIAELTLTFFRQDDEVKSADSIRHLHEGWQPFGGEFSITPDRPDLHESFWVTRRNATRAAATYSSMGRALHAKMVQHLSIMQHLEADITRDIRRHLGLEDVKESAIDGPLDADLQVLYYQPQRQHRDLLQDEHEDGLYMTLTWADSPGLEILGPNGVFHGLSQGRGRVSVLPGEILSLMSGCRIKPMIHRVRRHAEQLERLSINYFAVPDLDRSADIEKWIACPQHGAVSVADRIRHNRSQFLVQ